MWDREQQEFRQMVIASVLIHGVLLAFTLISTSSFSPRKRIEPMGGAINVMWAKTMQSPIATPEHKLPGPIVPPMETPVAAPEQPKVVETEKTSKAPSKEISTQVSDEEARKKAMADAVASISKDIEKRPMPKAENFPSTGVGEKGNYPAGPTGIGGIMGDPVFGAYRNQIRERISSNLVWLRSEKKQADVSFSIGPQGNIIDPFVSRSSGDSAFDNAAMRAVRRSSPLPLPPPELAQKVMEREFVMQFDVGKK